MELEEHYRHYKKGMSHPWANDNWLKDLVEIEFPKEAAAFIDTNITNYQKYSLIGMWKNFLDYDYDFGPDDDFHTMTVEDFYYFYKKIGMRTGMNKCEEKYAPLFCGIIENNYMDAFVKGKPLTHHVEAKKAYFKHLKEMGFLDALDSIIHRYYIPKYDYSHTFSYDIEVTDHFNNIISSIKKELDKADIDVVSVELIVNYNEGNERDGSQITVEPKTSEKITNSIARMPSDSSPTNKYTAINLDTYQGEKIKGYLPCKNVIVSLEDIMITTKLR